MWYCSEITARTLHATDLFDESRLELEQDLQLQLLAYLTQLRDAPKMESGDGFSAVALPDIHKAAHGIEFSIDAKDIVSVIVAFEGNNIVLISVYAGTSKNIPSKDYKRIADEIEIAIVDMKSEPIMPSRSVL